MSRVIQTATLTPTTLAQLHPQEVYQVYNGLDVCLTQEIFRSISASNEKPLTPAAKLIYDFERGMQAPALEMMLRGWRVNLRQRNAVVRKLEEDRDKVQAILDTLATVIWGKGLNANSPVQLKTFFYERLKCPEQYVYAKGQRKISTNRDSLEKLWDYFHARPFVQCITKLRELSKLISVLKSEVDPDGRFRTSFNVTGTETGRWSSSKNAYGGGGNQQNITEEVRPIFIADPGMKLAYVDKSQAESRVVGAILWKIFRDPSYLDACESGDLHTTVCKLVWRNLGWTGDAKADKAIAKQKFYRHFDYRDMAKRGGHGTNYYGKPPTMAKHLKVKTQLIEDFQASYFGAFPGIPRWHQWVAREIQTHQYLETMLGMGRHFFGRPDDDTTLREAIAFEPQSIVGQLLNLALWRIWKYLSPTVECLGQIHDAVVIQFPENREAEVREKVLALMPSPMIIHGREFIIPSDWQSGWNWGKYDEKSNPDGLRDWDGNDTRTRQFDPRATGLDQLIY